MSNCISVDFTILSGNQTEYLPILCFIFVVFKDSGKMPVYFEKVPRIVYNKRLDLFNFLQLEKL